MKSLMDRIIESQRVFVLGIAGDSGSGKTTISRGMRRMLGRDMVASFSMDDYHSLDRSERRARNITPLNPSANHLDLLADHLEALRRGESIEKPVYDHSIGEIEGTKHFGPAPVIIVEGLHPFYTERLRQAIDFKIFVDPSRQVKRLWKVRRDVGERGYDADQVRDEILRREPDYKLYIDIQKIYAEIVVKIQESKFHPSFWDHSFEQDCYSVRLIQEMVDLALPQVDLTINLSKILRTSEHEFSLEFQKDDYYGKKVGIMTIDGIIHQTMIAELEKRLCDTLGTDAVICDRQNDCVNAIGLAQLILTWSCIEKLENLLR